MFFFFFLSTNNRVNANNLFELVEDDRLRQEYFLKNTCFVIICNKKDKLLYNKMYVDLLFKIKISTWLTST